MTRAAAAALTAARMYSALGSSQHKIDAAAAALRAFEPLDPIDHRAMERSEVRPHCLCGTSWAQRRRKRSTSRWSQLFKSFSHLLSSVRSC
jgi:hypothetical protein